MGSYREEVEAERAKTRAKLADKEFITLAEAAILVDVGEFAVRSHVPRMYRKPGCRTYLVRRVDVLAAFQMHEMTDRDRLMTAGNLRRRFEIMERDGFACRYCGRRLVALAVDRDVITVREDLGPLLGQRQALELERGE